MTTTSARSAAAIQSAVEDRLIVGVVLEDLPTGNGSPLPPATADGFVFGWKVLSAAADGAVELDQAVSVRTFAFRLRREFEKGRRNDFGVGVSLACCRVLYSQVH
jgi:hypothetical protein